VVRVAGVEAGIDSTTSGFFSSVLTSSSTGASGLAASFASAAKYELENLTIGASGTLLFDSDSAAAWASPSAAYLASCLCFISSVTLTILRTLGALAGTGKAAARGPRILSCSSLLINSSFSG